MKSRLFLAAVSCLIAAGVVLSADHSAIAKNQWITKGYITIGGSIIVLPERLQSGDRIEFFGSTGERAMQQVVGLGYLSMNLSTIPSGVYSMVVYRENEIVTEHRVPVAGGK